MSDHGTLNRLAKRMDQQETFQANTARSLAQLGDQMVLQIETLANLAAEQHADREAAARRENKRQRERVYGGGFTVAVLVIILAALYPEHAESIHAFVGRLIATVTQGTR